MKSIRNMNLAELAAYICTHLMNNGIKCILTGGACISIYSENKYESFDLDFIDNSFTSKKKLAGILEEINFTESNRYFSNPETEYIVEFPSGPLSIGSQAVKEIKEIELSTGTLFIISPTDSFKDRLAAYFHWEDNQALEQALLLFKSQKINLKEAEKWAILEGQQIKFKRIKKMFTTKNNNL